MFRSLYIINVFINLRVKFFYTTSIIGFFLIMTLTLQILTGILLSFSLIPDPMLIPIVRDEEDIEVPYLDLIW